MFCKKSIKPHSENDNAKKIEHSITYDFIDVKPKAININNAENIIFAIILTIEEFISKNMYNDENPAITEAIIIL